MTTSRQGGVIVHSRDIVTDAYREAFEAMREALAHSLGAAETDCLDDESNVWRTFMLEARAALVLANQSIYESRFWYGWKGSKVRAPKGKGR